MTPEEIQQIKDQLSAAKSNLLTVLSTLDDEQWSTIVFSHGAEWTVSDVVRHVVQSEKGMAGLIKGILKGHPGAPVDFDRDAYNAKGVALLAEQGPAELVAAIDSIRVPTLELIDRLTAEDWKKVGRHGGAGRDVTVIEIFDILIGHQNGHAADIANAIAPAS